MSRINLSWNGFAVDGAKALGDALKLNAALEELDVSWVYTDVVVWHLKYVLWYDVANATYRVAW